MSRSDDPPLLEGDQQRGFLRDTMLVASADAVALVITAVQMRIVAESVGPAGLGVYGLLQSFFRIGTSFTATWLATPLTRWIANHRGPAGQFARFRLFRAATLTVLGGNGALAVVLLIAHEPVLKHVFSGEVSATQLWLFVGLTIASNMRTLTDSVLQGLSRWSRLAVLRVTGAMLTAAVAIALVLSRGLTGFFVGLLAAAVVLAGIGLTMAWPELAPRRDEAVLEEAPDLRGFYRFSGATLGLGVLFTAAEYAQRVIVLRVLGLHAVGIMQGGVAIVNYPSVVIRAVMTTTLPRVSHMDDDMRSVTETATRLSAVFAGVTSVCVIALGGVVVRLLLGDAFEPLVPHIPMFMAYWWVSSAQTPAGTALIGNAHIQAHVTASAATAVLPIAVIAAGVPAFGFGAVPLGLLAGQAVAYAIRLRALHRGGYAYGRNTLLLLGSCLLAMGVAAVALQTDSVAVQVLVAIVGAAWIISRLTRDELRELIRAGLQR